MIKKLVVVILVALLFIGGVGLYNFINYNPIIEFSNMGESQHWKVTGHIQESKEVLIFRPVLYLKSSFEEAIEMQVTWNLDKNLSFSDINSPQLQSDYTFSSYQATNMIDIPLQNFNFTKVNQKEAIKLLSKSSIEIKWKHGNGEEKKEIIYLDAGK